MDVFIRFAMGFDLGPKNYYTHFKKEQDSEYMHEMNGDLETKRSQPPDKDIIGGNMKKDDELSGSRWDSQFSGK
jgi:hypothetical protein